MPKPLSSLPPRDSGRGLALAYVLAGLFGAAASGSLFLTFVRDELHYQCVSAPGIAIGYVCRAGLAYYPYGAAVFVAYLVVVVLAAILLAPPVRRSRLRRIRPQLVAVLALLPGAIAYYAVRYVNPGTADWTQNIIVPVVIFGTAEVAILIAAVMPLRLVLQACVYLALSLCVVGAAVQPGFIAHVAVTLGLLVAVLILDYRRSLIK